MMHMTNDKCCRLALLLHEELALGGEELAAMEHILSCEECTRKLKRAMVIAESLDSIALVAALADRREKPAAPERTALFRIIVLDTIAMMQQETAASQWRFSEIIGPSSEPGFRKKMHIYDPPQSVARWMNMAPGSSGSMRFAGGGGWMIKKLVDTENRRTFVSCDPLRRCLTIQIDAPAPAVLLRTPNGQIRAIRLQKCGDLYRAETDTLQPGEYELILEWS